MAQVDLQRKTYTMALPPVKPIAELGLSLASAPASLTSERLRFTRGNRRRCTQRNRVKALSGICRREGAPLWRLAVRISAMRDSMPEDAVPLWYRPRTRQLAKDLYRASPPEPRRLLGPPGIQKTVKDMAHDLLKHLQQFYEVEYKAHEGALVLFPKPSSPPTESHRRATAALRGLLREALTEAAGRGGRGDNQKGGPPKLATPGRGV